MKEKRKNPRTCKLSIPSKHSPGWVSKRWGGVGGNESKCTLDNVIVDLMTCIIPLMMLLPSSQTDVVRGLCYQVLYLLALKNELSLDISARNKRQLRQV
jgi:hypothetical protein